MVRSPWQDRSRTRHGEAGKKIKPIPGFPGTRGRACEKRPSVERAQHYREGWRGMERLVDGRWPPDSTSAKLKVEVSCGPGSPASASASLSGVGSWRWREDRQVERGLRFMVHQNGRGSTIWGIRSGETGATWNVQRSTTVC